MTWGAWVLRCDAILFILHTSNIWNSQNLWLNDNDNLSGRQTFHQMHGSIELSYVMGEVRDLWETSLLSSGCSANDTSNIFILF